MLPAPIGYAPRPHARELPSRKSQLKATKKLSRPSQRVNAESRRLARALGERRAARTISQASRDTPKKNASQLITRLNEHNHSSVHNTVQLASPHVTGIINKITQDNLCYPSPPTWSATVGGAT